MEKRKQSGPRYAYAPIERRLHPRVAVDLPLAFQVISWREPERCSSFRKAKTKDLSLGGLSMITPEIMIDDLHISCDFDEFPFRENILYIVLELPEPYGPIRVKGQSVWFQQEQGLGGKGFSVGVKFLEFEDQDRQTLISYLNTLL